MDSLPDSLILAILKRLSIHDTYHAALCCKRWFACFHMPEVWRSVVFNFYRGSDDEFLLRCMDLHESDIQTVLIRLNQADSANRYLATEVLNRFAHSANRQLMSLTIQCTGENPLFYAGQEFVAALHSLLGEPISEPKKTLTHVDLSALPVMYTDEVFYALARHNPTLSYLNIQNKQLICKVSPDCLKTLVRSCKNLTDLRVFHSSLSNEVLSEFITANRQPIRHLSIICRRQEKYTQNDLSELAWQMLTESSPHLMVTLRFDHSCPLAKVREIMKHSMPVYTLYLETYTMIFEELQFATKIYAKTLRKVVIQTQPSDELETALIDLATKASLLESLHVMCPLSLSTIDSIHSLVPRLLESKDFTLKHDIEAHPWVSDDVLDEIRDHWK